MLVILSRRNRGGGRVGAVDDGEGSAGKDRGWVEMTPQFLPRKFFAKRAALETNIAGAAVVADALRLALASHAFDPDGASLTVTASFGAAEQPFETTIANADRALYSAKEEGRNRVAVAGV